MGDRIILLALALIAVPVLGTAQTLPKTIDTGFSVASNQSVREVTLADVDGDGVPEICSIVQEIQRGVKAFELEERELIIYQFKSKRELGRIGLGREFEAGQRAFGLLIAADIDGDGDDEIIGIRAVERPDFPASAFSIFDWVGNSLKKTDIYTFRGGTGRAGDIDGDGKDEILLINWPEGFQGSTQILILKWNGEDFELLAEARLANVYVVPILSDVDQDGLQEVVVLTSGLRGSETSHPQIPPARLVIYKYNGTDHLEQFTDRELPTSMLLGHLWKEKINDKYQLIVPVFGEDGRGSFDKMVFRVEDNALIQNQNITIRYDAFFQGKGMRDVPQQLLEFDADGDGEPELLVIESKKTIKLIKIRFSEE